MSPEQAASVEDVVVVGGGGGGLSAAMWLGRYRRATMVVDSGNQRNLPSHKSHGYVTRDGVPPEELLELARHDAIAYEAVRIESGEVTSIGRARDDFDVAIGWGEHTAGYALDLLEWGARVTLVTNGETFEGDEACRVALERNNIELVEERRHSWDRVPDVAKAIARIAWARLGGLMRRLRLRRAPAVAGPPAGGRRRSIHEQPSS